MTAGLEYIDAVQAGVQAASSSVVSGSEIIDFLNQFSSPVSILDGHAQSYPGTGPAVNDFICVRRALAFLEAFQAAPGWDMSTIWTYSHEPGVSNGPFDLRGEGSLESFDAATGTAPCLGDGIIVETVSFAGREADLMRVMGRLASTGATLVLTHTETLGLPREPLATWLQDHFGYVPAMRDGCVYRPIAEGIDF